MSKTFLPNPPSCKPSQPPFLPQVFLRVSQTVLIAIGLTVTISQPGQATRGTEPEIRVGVVQRFGTAPTDKLILEAPQGDRLTLQFKTGNQVQRVTTNRVQLEIVPQPLSQPVLEERVIFSTHRSFESAEDDAKRWRARGIEVDLAQPKRWQVWAKQDTYNTPLLRRLLIQSLQTQGVQFHFESKLVRQVPRVSWVVNGFRYSRDELDIVAGKRLIQVQKNTSDERVTRLYAGSLRIQPNAYGTYTLVNQVSIETYLRGVVPHEIGLGAPPETIEAQAILARTYALRNLRRFAIDHYELCADTQCQVYWGLKGSHPKTDQAILNTRGLVLTYNNELVDALYSSTTGGITAPFNDVWNGPDRPYLRAVVDSANKIWDLSRQSLGDERNLRQFLNRRQGFNEERWEMFRWRYPSTLTDITRDLQKYLRSINSPDAGLKAVQKIQVTKRSPFGRVLKVAITTDRGVIEIEKDNILNAFYAPTSTLFYLEPLNGPNKVLQGYAFVGGGMGHGVGLSQTGSYRLGELGWTSDRILQFYYPGTQLQPISPTITFWREPSLPSPN
ncbi:MAG: SpoIID/LytB domain-containing protein [Leptolyngbyaceae cyanobacterium bins.59]|nr:SpoIID/LytB domain-containing protein [Leptolyngbyaceae cyanobacterium bins.59]